MKTNKLFLIGLVAAGLTACSSDRDAASFQKEDVNTYAGLTITVASPATRADVNQAQADNVGREAESKVARVSLFSTLNNHDWTNSNNSKPASPTAVDFWLTGTGTYTVGAFAAAAGTQKMGLVINHAIGAVTPIDINTTTVGVSWVDASHNAIKTIERLSAENNFCMTSRRADYTVRDGVEKDVVDAQATADPTKNVFGFELERLVSQAVVSKASGLTSTTSDVANSRVTVDLDNLTYAVINGATSINFWLDNAGDRTITDVGAGTMKYNGLQSAIHDYLGDISDNWNNAKSQTKTDAKLIRLGNYAPFTASVLTSNKAARTTERNDRNAELGGYAPIPVFASAQMADPASAVVSSRGIYFLENSVGSGSYTKSNKDVGFYRLAYAKVYGQVKPVKIYGVKYEDDGVGGIKTSWDVVEYTIATQAAYDAMPEGTVAEKIAKAHTYVEYTTFYKGQDDDFLYANPLGAMIGYAMHNTWANDTEKTANAQPYYTYLDARCAWRSLLNRQTGASDPNDDITKAVQTANTRRNNIYWLEIGEFKKIGMPYDPSDPNDPNLPKATKDQPTDPDNEDKPDDPDIEVQHTFMKVVARVLQWNVVKRTSIFY